MYDHPELGTLAAAPQTQKLYGVINEPLYGVINEPGRGIDYNAPVAQELLRRIGYFVGF